MTLEKLKDDRASTSASTSWSRPKSRRSPAPSDAEAQEFYDEESRQVQAGRGGPRQPHPLPRRRERRCGGQEESEGEAQSRAEAGAAGADFAKLAKEVLRRTAAPQQGGDLNFFPRARWCRRSSKAAFALKPGEISDIVTTQFGYHIIKVTDHKSGRDGSVRTGAARGSRSS